MKTRHKAEAAAGSSRVSGRRSTSDAARWEHDRQEYLRCSNTWPLGRAFVIKGSRWFGQTSPRKGLTAYKNKKCQKAKANGF